MPPQPVTSPQAPDTMTTAIVTKFHGPTSTRGARISATWGSDRLVGGSLPDGRYIFVVAP